MDTMTFDQLPSAVVQLSRQMDNLEQQINKLLNEKRPETDHWFNINGLSEYLPDHPAKQTIYGWVSKKEIPYNKGGKSLRFLKSEIDAWIKQGRKLTRTETAEANLYKSKKRRG
jgi:excisionase family DNA binding protein